MNQPPDPTRSFDEAPRQDSRADGPVSAPPEKAVSDRLELLEEIARGGMGAILRGRDGDIGRDVAVKILLSDHRGRPELAQRFLEEARIAGRLQHPGVVPVYALGRMPDGRPYFTMKLIKGRTLTALLAERKDVSDDLPRLLAVFEQVCQTLAYAHDRGVIHRDLKPANVMVGTYGEVQVMDWGLAKVLKPGEATAADGATACVEAMSVIRTPRGEEADAGEDGAETRAGSVLGTPAYMAPEQARGEVEDVDRRSDVFGLGAVLCEMLTGRPPFAGPSEAALKRARRGDLDDAFARLDACGAEAELIGLAKRCLAAQPEKRPRDASEAAAALTAYRESAAERLHLAELARAAEEARAGEARATAEQERKAREAAQARSAAERRARRLTLALAALFLLAGATAAVGMLWWQRDQAAQAADHARRAAETERVVTAALGEATALGNQAATLKDDPAKWEAALSEGLSAVKRAEGLLGAGEATDDLRRRVALARVKLESADKDRRMVARLDEAQLQIAEPAVNGGNYDHEGSAALYAKAFRDDLGLDLRTVVPEDAAARINGRAIRDELLGGLDDWLFVLHEAADKNAVVAILRAADPGAASIRNRVRVAVQVGDREALTRMAEGDEVRNLSARDLEALGRALGAVGAEDEALRLLKGAQSRYPNALWINFDLAEHLTKTRPPAWEEAARYLTAAMALYPQSPGVHESLGIALDHIGRFDEAVLELRRAVELNPRYVESHNNLALVLAEAGRQGEAIQEWRRIIKENLNDAFARNQLGLLLRGQGELDEAIAEFREAARLDRDVYGVAPALSAPAKNLADAEKTKSLQGQLPALQKGDFKPKTEDELRRLFRLCTAKGLYRTGARMGADAFAADASLAADLNTGDRYDAACCAARAGCGDGADAKDLDDRERAGWRKQALDWLRADQEAWAKRLDGGKPEDQKEVAATLRHWQEDADLSGLRDPAELAKLPADEQEACRKLWADVQALLDKADGKR